MLRRISWASALVLSVLAMACASSAENQKPPPAETAASPAPTESAPAAAEGGDWKARFQSAIEAIEAAEDPWTAMCARIDVLGKAWVEGDAEVKRVLKFDEQWSRLGAKLSRNRANCERNTRTVYLSGSNVVTDLKTPWEDVKAKLP